MKIEDFNYELPRELIAQKPFSPRDRCRLLVLHRKDGKIEHRVFYEIIEYLNEGDILVINTTKVIPARIIGQKKSTGGKVEIFLLKRIGSGKWQCLLKPFPRVKEGTEVVFPGVDLEAEILKKEKGVAEVEFSSSTSVEDNLFKAGKIPLPPYIKRKEGPTEEDEKEYQTVYATHPGAVAAPTAGLHFTFELLEKIKKKGVKVAEIVLHTGWASFFILKEKEVEKSSLPSEYFEIPSCEAEKINQCKIKGGKVVAVGTTTVRALEANSQGSFVLPGKGWTDLFIYPGYKFKVIDALLTNFHMPSSSLLLLVCAFGGKEKVLSAYREAVKKKYRFLSYGDAMLII